MTTSDQPSLLPQITQQQANKSVTANDQANQLDKMVAKVVTIDFDTEGDADYTLTTAEAVGFMELRLIGTITADRQIRFPRRGTPGTEDNIFFFRLFTNDTTGGFNINVVYEANRDGTAFTGDAAEVEFDNTSLIIGDRVDCLNREFGARLGAFRPAVLTVAASRDVLTSDENAILETTGASGAVTFTIEADSVRNLPIGFVVAIIRKTSNAVNIEAATGVSLNGISAGSTVISTEEKAASIVKIAANTWQIIGDVAQVA